MNDAYNHKVIRYKLINDELKPGEFGIVSFNGKFTFDLAEDIDIDVWQRVGIIPLENGSKHVEVQDLFYFLNSRLPQRLRKASVPEKLNYIQETGLRVASDNFRLELIED